MVWKRLGCDCGKHRDLKGPQMYQLGQCGMPAPARLIFKPNARLSFLLPVALTLASRCPPRPKTARPEKSPLTP